VRWRARRAATARVIRPDSELEGVGDEGVFGVCHRQQIQGHPDTGSRIRWHAGPADDRPRQKRGIPLGGADGVSSADA
jgi:hypothetical protein